MSKILLLSSGLEKSHEFVLPFMERITSYLSRDSDFVDVRNIKNFDERTFFEYDQIVFVFFVAMQSIPSSTLEIFEKLEKQNKGHIEVYSLIISDEYETEKCDYADQVIKNWCQKENLNMKGSLKIGSGLVIMKTASRFVVSNYIKKFADSILKHTDANYRITLMNEKTFLKKANQYWLKEIRKNYKTRN